jgi:glyoxylase-like metal-dependent hydrolase (beta-lactamase superfamily II)
LISHPGRGHTTADLIVSIPEVAGGAGRPVVFCGDLVEEAGDPVIDADYEVAAWPATLDRILEAGGHTCLVMGLSSIPVLCVVNELQSYRFSP